MLAVLLEGARPGQEFPRVAESVDLIWGALRMRLRLGEPYEGNIGSDALAAFSLLAPLVLLGPVLATIALHLVHGPPAPDPQFRIRFPAVSQIYDARIAAAHGVNLAAEGQLAVAIAVVLRLRRIALAVIAVVLALWIFDARYGFGFGGVFRDLFLSCYALEAIALIASPGPRRGLQLLTWRSGAALAAAAATLTITWTLTMRLAYGSCTAQSAASCTYFTSRAAAEVNGLAVVALLAFGCVVLFSQLGRYVVVLFAAMFYPYGLFLGVVVGAVPAPPQPPEIGFAILYLPPVVASCAIVAIARHRRDRRVPNRPRGTSASA